MPGLAPFMPASDWCHGGPIIERERIVLAPAGDGWRAAKFDRVEASPWRGATPLIAAVRAYVASKFGDEVEL